jgi:hypothetical protein
MSDQPQQEVTFASQFITNVNNLRHYFAIYSALLLEQNQLNVAEITEMDKKNMATCLQNVRYSLMQVYLDYKSFESSLDESQRIKELDKIYEEANTKFQINAIPEEGKVPPAFKFLLLVNELIFKHFSGKIFDSASKTLHMMQMK